MRWLSFARVSSQRVGSLLAVLAAASDSRATSLEGISRLYEPTLRRAVRVPDDRAAAVHEYLNRQHLWERYRALKTTSTEAIVGAEIQIQDLWLSDPSLPSAAGAITERVLDEPPQLAVALRFLRGENYTLTDRGKAMTAAASAGIVSLRSGDAAVNPFLLSAGSRLFFLYVLLEEDFDFLRAAYATQLGDLREGFTRMDFALRLDEACAQLRTTWVRRVRSGTDRKRLARLGELEKKIRDVREGKAGGKLDTWGGGRTPDQLATVRLEPLVDAGMIGRSRFDYTYSLSGGQRRFFERVVATESADEFLQTQLFQAYLDGLAIEPRHVGADEAWTRIQDAHASVRSSLGYASFKEVVILAMSRLADEQPGSYFELQDGIEVLEEQHHRQPRAVRYGIARGGGLTYIKITDSGRRR